MGGAQCAAALPLRRAIASNSPADQARVLTGDGNGNGLES
jgi:hypothetical protein